MKKPFLLLSMLVGFALSTWAQTSNLVVFSEDATPFYLVVNGVKQNSIAQTNIKITELTNPNNSVVVIFQNQTLGSVKQNFYFPEMGVEVTAKITNTPKGYKLRYFGEVPLAQATSSSAQFTTPFQNVEPLNTAATTPKPAPAPAPAPVPQTQPAPAPAQPVATTPSPAPKPTAQTPPPAKPAPAPAPKSAPAPIQKPQPAQPAVASAGPVNMKYKWTAGKKYTFAVTQTDNVSTSMMGMSMKDQFLGKTEFLMVINSVATNGDANGTLYLIDYSVVDSKGKVLASLVDLPSNAIRSDFKVDAKGNFTFLKKITLVTTAQGNALVYASATDNSVTAGGQAGDVKVEAYAEFDPKTGSLKAGYTIKEAQPVKQITIKMDENTDVVDVLPYDYLSMLALPDGSISQGDKAQVNAGIYTIDILAKSISNGTAQMNYKMGSDKSKSPMESSTKMESQNTSMSMEMPTNQMMSEMSPEDQQAMDMSKQMMPTITMDFDSFFDYNAGMFNNVKGIMTTTINTMGMKMEVVSNLEMKKL